jgi:hypothetical protein
LGIRRAPTPSAEYLWFDDSHETRNAERPMKSRDIPEAPIIDRALRRVLGEIHDGLRHGYFEFTLSCEVTGQGRRRLQLRAGKTYQFLIPAEECEPADKARDLRHEGALDSRS